MGSEMCIRDRLGGDVLTCVVTLGGAVPEKKAVIEGCRSVQFMLSLARLCVYSYEWTVHRRRSSHWCSPITLSALLLKYQHQHADKSTFNFQEQVTYGDATLELRLAIT